MAISALIIFALWSYGGLVNATCAPGSTPISCDGVIDDAFCVPLPCSTDADCSMYPGTSCYEREVCLTYASCINSVVYPIIEAGCARSGS